MSVKNKYERRKLFKILYSKMLSYPVLRVDTRLEAACQLLQLISFHFLNLDVSVDKPDDGRLVRAGVQVCEVCPECLTANISGHFLIDTITENIIFRTLTGTFLSVYQDVLHHLDVDVDQSRALPHPVQSSRHGVWVYCDEVVCRVKESDPEEHRGVESNHQGFAPFKLYFSLTWGEQLEETMTKILPHIAHQVCVQYDVIESEGVLFQTLPQSITFLPLTLQRTQVNIQRLKFDPGRSFSISL